MPKVKMVVKSGKMYRQGLVWKKEGEEVLVEKGGKYKNLLPVIEPPKATRKTSKTSVLD